MRYENRREYLTDKLKRLEKYSDEIKRSYKDVELTVLGTIKFKEVMFEETDKWQSTNP